MYNMQVSTTAPQTDSTPTVTDSQQPSNSNILYPGMLTSDFPMIDMGDLHIENEIVVQSSNSISPLASSSSANTQLPQQNILASPESDSSIIVTTQSELIMNDDNMYQESFQNTHMVCNDNNNSLTTMIEQQPQSPPLQHQQSNLTTEIVMAESSFGNSSDLSIEQKKDHQENKVILSGRVSDTLLQNIVASIPNSSLQIQSQPKSHDFKPNQQQQQQQIHQMPQSSMIKVNVSNQGTTQRPPMFVNQPIISSGNVQTIQNSMGNISYILPSSNISKQAIVNKATTLNLVSSQNIVGTSSSPVLVQNTSQQMNVDNNSSNIPKCNANFRLIQTSQGQQLVLSPIKSTSFSNNNIRTASTVGSNVTIKPSTSKIFTGTTQQLVSSVPNLQQQQQQLIILSPVKGQNIATKPTFLPATSVKILPNPNTGTKMQNIAPAPAKRILAPAGSKQLGTMGSSAVGVSGIGNKPIQTLVHSNNKNVHYISFVPVSTGNQLSTQAKLISANPKYLPLKPMIANKANFTTTSSSTSQGTKSNVVQVGQKVLINPSSIKISSTVPASSVVSSITTANSSHSSANKRNPPTSIWMLPKQQVIKIGDNPLNTFHVHQKPSKFIPIAPNPVQANSVVTEAPKTPASVTIKMESSPTETEEARRRPCNCTRSQCLKLYCDCFANGEFCNNCNCVSCYNNLEYEEVRQKAIRLCLERNPNAFHPKIGQSNQGDIERRHTKGCNCKRSGCLKNYCECYEAKILCSDKCKCNGCKNFEESTERKTLMHLADAAEVRSAQQSVATKMHIWGPDLKPKLPIKVKSDCHPFNIFTMDILEATASCLLAQGEEGEFENYSEENVQSLILDQFGECLSQILNLSTNGTTEDLIDGTDDDSTMNDYENS